MPQQIDPNTGQPIGLGTGDLEGGTPRNTIPGLSGLTDAHLVDDNYQLRPFEYFRNEGGRRYVQNALTNPGETPGYQPPPPPGASQPNGGGPMPPALPPPPQTGGGDPYQSMMGTPFPVGGGGFNYGSPPGGLSFAGGSRNFDESTGQYRQPGNGGFSGANPWTSFFQGLSRPQRGPNGGSQYNSTTGAESRDMNIGEMPQRWQQTQRGFNPGGSSMSLPPPSPYPSPMRSAVMPPMRGGQSSKSPFGQMATPEGGNQGGQMPPWFRQFQAMLPQATALPQPQTTMQPLANAGYFPPPSLPAPVQPETFNGGPG